MLWKKLVATALILGLAVVANAASRVDLNTASASELSDGLNGVGPSKAQAIVEHREQNGPFESVDDLVLVKGVGASILEQNVDRMRVGGRD